MSKTTEILLLPLKASDAAAIRAWPKYEGEFELLDYALRPGGWLDRFPESPGTRRLAAWDRGVLIGFSLLVDITRDSAEFYIAIHPLRTGHGLGREITVRTLRVAFTEIYLRRVYLKVRVWHAHAIALYQNVGFVDTGRKSEEVQGAAVEFCTMEISRADFLKRWDRL